MYIRRSIIALLALASFGGLVISTAACGSSSSPTSPTTTSDVTVSIVGNLGAQSFTPSPVVAGDQRADGIELGADPIRSDEVHGVPLAPFVVAISSDHIDIQLRDDAIEGDGWVVDEVA